MDSGLSEYKDLFVETGKEYLKSLNDALLVLEKDPADKDAIGTIFRNAHSLKGQSAAMGYEKTGFLCHAVEDVFFEIKEGHMKTTPELADLLFTAFDELDKSVAHIDETGEEIDLSAQAEALKKLTGVKTTGADKSVREPEAAPVAAEPAAGPAAESAAEEPVATKEPAVEEPTPPAAEAAPTNQPAIKIKTIPVKTEQLDEMLSLLEELMVYRLVLKQLVHESGNIKLENYMDQTKKIISALQFQIMSVRAVPVKMVFDHFPRAVRDLAREENKEIELVVEGEDLELDRTIVERLDEPLTHLIRNAASHGIDKSGVIRLSARREKDYAVVEVADNGLGVDWEAVAKKAKVETRDPAELKKLLFSGISTSQTVTQVSGRGVGLEVVKKTIEEFGGSIDVSSETGHGTTFIVRLPLTLAVMKALLVRVSQERYAITTSSVDRTVKVPIEHIQKSGGQEVFILEQAEIPLIRLVQKLHPSDVPDETQTQDILVVIVTIGDERVGLVVDDIIEASEIIIKPVPAILRGNAAFAGATILGDGQSALILNPQGLL